MTAVAGTDAAVDLVGRLLSQTIGLRSEGTLRGRLRRCIIDEAARQGDDLAAYVERVNRDGRSLQSLVNRVTVQESGFFRHPEHFEILANSILPGVDPPVTVWSAACGNGQEAYSLAMLLEELGVPGSVVATDLSTKALARTAGAWYTSQEISGLSPRRRTVQLVPEDGGFRVSPLVRARVTSGVHNLVGAVPSHVGSCQVVFCRNVLIYLSAEHARAFLDRLADALTPGSYLFLGGAETLWQVSDRFQAVRLGGAFVYRRRGPGARAQSKPAEPMKVVERWVRRPAAAPRPPRAQLSAEIVRTAGDGDRDQIVVLAEAGRQALASGDHMKAIVTFRKWAYLAPNDPLGSFHLGMALEAGGHAGAAQRAFAVAREAVLSGAGSVPVESGLKGFTKDEFLKLLDAKQVPFR